MSATSGPAPSTAPSLSANVMRPTGSAQATREPSGETDMLLLMTSSDAMTVWLNEAFSHHGRDASARVMYPTSDLSP